MNELHINSYEIVRYFNNSFLKDSRVVSLQHVRQLLPLSKKRLALIEMFLKESCLESVFYPIFQDQQFVWFCIVQIINKTISCVVGYRQRCPSYPSIATQPWNIAVTRVWTPSTNTAYFIRFMKALNKRIKT